MSKESKSTNVTLTSEELKVMNTMIRVGVSGNETTRHLILKEMNNAADLIARHRNFPNLMFTVEDALHFLSQVVEAPMEKHTEMLGKRIGPGEYKGSDFVKILK